MLDDSRYAGIFNGKIWRLVSRCSEVEKDWRRIEFNRWALS